MAIVRICQLGELDDLADAHRRTARNGQRTPSAPAERGPTTAEPAQSTAPARARRRPQKKTLSRAAAVAASSQRAVAARTSNGLATRSPSRPASCREAAQPNDAIRTRPTQPHSKRRCDCDESDQPPTIEPHAAESVLAQFQRAMADGAHASRRARRRRAHRAASNWRKSPSSHSSAARWNCSTSRRTNFATRRRRATRTKTEFATEDTEITEQCRLGMGAYDYFFVRHLRALCVLRRK